VSHLLQGRLKNDNAGRWGPHPRQCRNASAAISARAAAGGPGSSSGSALPGAAPGITRGFSNGALNFAAWGQVLAS